MLRIKESYYGTLLFGLCLLSFFPFLGAVHLFDWDEINFAESAREMIETGDFFTVRIGYEPFWEKPPLFFWLQTASMKIFGINEFAARFPNAIFGVLTVMLLFYSGTRMANRSFGFTWAFLFLVSFLPFLYFKSGIIDPVFNFFIYLSMLLLVDGIRNGRPLRISRAFLAGAVNGLAILTKGPVAFLLILLTFIIVWMLQRGKKNISPAPAVLFILGAILTSSLWYLPELFQNGWWFLKKFIVYQAELFTKPIAGHQQPFYYHFVVVLIGCFPMSVLALPAIFRKKNSPDVFPESLSFTTDGLRMVKKWNLVLLGVVLILFSIVTTKIVHYSSMAYLPLSFLAAWYLHGQLQRHHTIPKSVTAVLLFLGIIFSLIFIAVPLLAIRKEWLLPLFKDPFAVASFSQKVHWSGWEPLIGVLFLAALLLWLFLNRRREAWKGIFLYGLLSLFVLNVYLRVVVPKIESYSQGSIIHFYKSIQGQDVYVVPVGFKSYAHYFYFRQPMQPSAPAGPDKKEWLTHGPADKPVYLIFLNTFKHFADYPHLTWVQDTGGYKIFRRERQAGGR